MTAESQNSLMRRGVIVRQRRSKHISTATDTDATIEDAVFSVWSVPSYIGNEDQLDKPGVRSELVKSELR
jgi:hypothetical protein